MGQSTPLSGAGTRPTAAEPLDMAFARLLLQGLACAASVNPRREVDLAEALQIAGLPTSCAAQIRLALRQLVATGCVANLQPTADGGLLLIVTGRTLTGDDDMDGILFPPPADQSGTPAPRATTEAPD